MLLLSNYIKKIDVAVVITFLHYDVNIEKTHDMYMYVPFVNISLMSMDTLKGCNIKPMFGSYGH